MPPLLGRAVGILPTRQCGADQLENCSPADTLSIPCCRTPATDGLVVNLNELYSTAGTHHCTSGNVTVWKELSDIDL